MLRFLFPVLLICAACGNSNKADFEVRKELELIDTLQLRLGEIRAWLDYFPLNELRERIEIIDHNIEFCTILLEERKLVQDEEMSKTFEEYRAYGKLYSQAVENYSPIVVNMEELIIQLRTLKESARGKDYKKAIFLEYFRREKNDVEQLFRLASHILKPLKETDLDYERVQNKVEEYAEELKNPGEF